MMILIFMMIMMIVSCIMSVMAGGGWLLFYAKEEGDSCKGDDKKGEYEIDEDGDCTFMQCKAGFALHEGVCTEDKSGDECEPSGAKDPHGIYETNIPGQCTFVSCESGYGLEDGVCVEGGSGSGESDCEPTGSKDPFGVYRQNYVLGECVLAECNDGREISSDGTCVLPSGGSGSGSGSGRCAIRTDDVITPILGRKDMCDTILNGGGGAGGAVMQACGTFMSEWSEIESLVGSSDLNNCKSKRLTEYDGIQIMIEES